MLISYFPELFNFDCKSFVMKLLFTAVFVFALFAVSAQSSALPQPAEQQYHISYWLWVLGVLLALGAGIILYMLIKKDPKRDAVK